MSKILLKSREDENNFNNEIMQKIKAIKEENILKGVKNIYGVYIPYEYKIIINDITYYINMCLANGKNKFGIMEICKHYKAVGFNSIDEFIIAIEMKKFAYKVINYDDINFIYIFNDKYKQMF